MFLLWHPTLPLCPSQTHLNKFHWRQVSFGEKSTYITIENRAQQPEEVLFSCTSAHVVDSTGLWQNGSLNKSLRAIIKPRGWLAR